MTETDTLRTPILEKGTCRTIGAPCWALRQAGTPVHLGQPERPTDHPSGDLASNSLHTKVFRQFSPQPSAEKIQTGPGVPTWQWHRVGQPIGIYRTTMLIWSLWLVFALLRWIR